MGLEWVLLGLLIGVALWLGVDACRESKRLHARLARVHIDRPRLVEGELLGRGGDWAYWPLTTSAAEDARIGPRL
ncbi:MAG TPA: hypothetical protein VL595_13820 [Pseudonocardia sp.]|jgi:hypothetical protein|nr:hypothetical protein [Pseudonocardia sp.]